MNDLVVAAGAVVAVGVLLGVPIRVPDGGDVPVGLAGVLAALALGGDGTGTLVALSAFALFVALHRERVVAVPRAVEITGAVLGAAVAPDGLVLVTVAGAGAGVVVARIASGLVRQLVPEGPDARSALPVDLTLACGAALVAQTTVDVGWTMALVAAAPLLLVRFAFERQAEAASTLSETVQALGLVPELAGTVSLGHSERTSRYAEAVAAAAGCGRREVERVVVGARLHHLGDVADVDGPDAAATGSRILADAGFRSDVVELLARSEGHAAAGDVGVAALRVACAFDRAVGDDAGAADRALALVALGAQDGDERRATAALLRVVAERPLLVEEVVAAGRRFREAAGGLDLEAIVGGETAELLPMTRRRIGKVPPGARRHP